MNKLLNGRNIAQRRILAIVLAIVLAFTLGLTLGTPSQSHAATTDPYMTSAPITEHTSAFTGTKEKNVEIIEKKEIDDLSLDDRKTIERAVSVSASDGESAALMVNDFSGDDEIFEIAANEVLHNYYEKDDVKGEIEKFSERIDEKAAVLLARYREAYDERKNVNNLNYSPFNIILTVDKGTKDSTIDKLVNNISEEYEVLVDDDFVIDDDLSQKRKERLQKYKDNYTPKITISVKLGLDQSTERAMAQYREYSCVDTVERDMIAEIAEVSTNDTHLSKQWYLDQIYAEEAWAVQDSTASYYGFAEAWVAVIDTGLDTDHEDIKGRFVPSRSVDVTKTDAAGNYKLLTDLSHASRYDGNHGTHVAGIIAAKADNGKGICGIGSGYFNDLVRVLAIKASNGAPSFLISDLIKGVDYATTRGAEVINLSLGTPSYSSTLETALVNAYNAGVTACAAAGNDGVSTLLYPAAYSTVIAVAATTKGDTRASFSNYGAWIDIAAPGVSIYSLITPTNKYGYMDGTSMAAPCVSAVAGIMHTVSLYYLNKDAILNYMHGWYINGNMGKGVIDAEWSAQEAKWQSFKNTTVTLKSVTALGSNALRIKWNNSGVYGPEKTKIYRSTSLNGTYTLVKTINSGSVVSWDNTGLTKGTTYYYKVRCAMDHQGVDGHTAYSGILSRKVT